MSYRMLKKFCNKIFTMNILLAIAYMTAIWNCIFLQKKLLNIFMVVKHKLKYVIINVLW